MVDWVREYRDGGHGGHGGDYGSIGESQFSLGRMATALVRRDRSHLTDVETRALLEGTDSAGGFLTPEILSAEVIDRLRAQARTFQAGARVVPMISDQMLFARLTGGVTPSWKTEGSSIADQSMTFDRVLLKPQTLPLLVKISQELFDDLSPEASTIIEQEMLKALALELDRVVLLGSGVTPTPTGIVNQTSVTNQSLGANGGSLTGYDDFSTAMATVRSKNLEPNAAIVSARTAGQMDRLKNSLGDPLRKPPSVDALTFYVSNVIPDNLSVGTSGAVCSDAFVAQWDQVLVGMRTDVRVGIRALDQRFADNLQVGLLCYLRADVAMRHGESAVVITGIKG
jgi:HK97 family phage major capsid protein